MSKYTIRISVKGFFFNSNDELLLVVGQRRTHEGRSYYAAPGGGVEEGEDLVTTVKRELLEETGYAGIPDKVVFVQDYLNKGKGRQFEVFFIGKIDESKAPLDNPDHKIKFFSKKAFSKISFLPRVNPFDLRESASIDYKTYLNIA